MCRLLIRLTDVYWKFEFELASQYAFAKVFGRAEKGRAVKRQSALGPMCDAEKDWHERSFRASGAINGCQKSPMDKPEMTFSFLILKPPLTTF